MRRAQKRRVVLLLDLILDLSRVCACFLFLCAIGTGRRSSWHNNGFVCRSGLVNRQNLHRDPGGSNIIPTRGRQPATSLALLLQHAGLRGRYDHRVAHGLHNVGHDGVHHEFSRLRILLFRERTVVVVGAARRRLRRGLPGSGLPPRGRGTAGAAGRTLRFPAVLVRFWHKHVDRAGAGEFLDLYIHVLHQAHDWRSRLDG
mmetsp:Transcript_1668/g.3895  ORF Transcript_1668/g.3895 Transcript_1668/m.3895 type:complete len:201 (-) Transcript_1668:743-1345(-)